MFLLINLKCSTFVETNYLSPNHHKIMKAEPRQLIPQKLPVNLELLCIHFSYILAHAITD